MTQAGELISDSPATDLREELIIEAFKCLECGKCTGSCPMAQLFPGEFHPHHLLHDLVHRPEEALNGVSLWFCASCYKCNKRCPQAIELPYIILKMRALSLKNNGVQLLHKAFEKIRDRIPFPLSFLSTCIHPERIGLDMAVLQDLHKYNMSNPLTQEFPVSKRSVAIVGSGPAGLTAAYELRKLGYRVKIFEAESMAGGMFSLAIPEYRIPMQIIRDETGMIERSGIEIQLNTRIGKDYPLQQLFEEGYDAILLATGAHHCKSMDIPGEDFEGYYNSLDFLKALKIQSRDIRNKTVAVIGGGNTAMDAASVAVKYGAKEVFLLYRRTREEMPADINEIRETEKEGVEIRFLESPLGIHGEKSKVSALECIKMELGGTDLTGRRRPVPVEGSNFILNTDVVVMAIGEEPDMDSVRDEFARGRNNTILVNPFTMETSIPGVFAAGDSVSGPATVADAILEARKAAAGIHTKLTHHDEG